MMQLTGVELELIIEALKSRAARHESESRYNPRAAGPHDRKAAAMRALVKKLEQRRAA